MVRQRSIFVTGDTHGDIRRFRPKNFPEGVPLNKEDLVFQLGDFGVIWNDARAKEEKYWMDWLIEKPWTTIVILGNHEGYDRIFKLPETELFGAKCWEYKNENGSVYFVKAGEIMAIDNKTFLCVRGATSIDKMYRIEGRDYWDQETLSREEEEHTLNNLDKIGWKVDYLLTHTCPNTVIQAFLDSPSSPKFNDPVSKFLEFIVNKLEFKVNLFGHFHTSRVFIDGASDNFICFYEKIINLIDIDIEVSKNENR